MSSDYVVDLPSPLAVQVEDLPFTPLHAPGGFAEWYRQQYTGVVRLAFLLVDSIDIAEEVAQDAFAAVFERFSALDNPDAYLRRCVVNGGREVQRKRRVARRYPPREGQSASLAADHVIEIVRRLPYRQRAVIVLRFYGGMNLAEIAETMAVPVGTIKSTMHRAVARLREELSE